MRLIVQCHFCLLLSFLFSMSAAKAQNETGTDDYKVYRESQLKLSCTPQDSATIITKLFQLQLLDTTQFTKNMDDYYQDLGWAYTD